MLGVGISLLVNGSNSSSSLAMMLESTRDCTVQTFVGAQ